MARLTDAFFAEDTITIAKALLGKRLVSRIDGLLTCGLIVESEAYLSSDDSACHAAIGMTQRNQSMFGEAGRSYVYAIHAKWCFNVVTGESGTGSAVLIRAMQPLFGIDAMVQRRVSSDLTTLLAGPARLCQSMGITKVQDGLDLNRSKELWLDDFNAVDYREEEIRVTERIGVTSAEDLQLRFVVKGSPFASGPKKLR